MKYKPENVKLVVTHNSVEQEVERFDESTCFDECSEVSEEQIEWLIERVSKTKEDSKKSKTKSSRCKGTIDWVEEEYGDAYKKPKKGSTLVKHLTKSEIESLRQNKRDAYALMMKMD